MKNRRRRGTNGHAFAGVSLASGRAKGYNSAMGDEIEIKFRAKDFAAVRRALKACGAKYVSTVDQTDTFFDTPEATLLAAGSGLRVRRTRVLRSAGGQADTRPLVTFKGPVKPGSRAKIRREIQTRCDQPGAMEDILRALGMHSALTVEKRRASYKFGRCTVELDEVAGLGRFVEIEGPGEAAVLAVGAKLNLTGKPITLGYAEMLAAGE